MARVVLPGFVPREPKASIIPELPGAPGMGQEAPMLGNGMQAATDRMRARAERHRWWDGDEALRSLGDQPLRASSP